MAAFASSGQRPRTWAQDGAATEQVHGTYANTANQRLSYCRCRWCWLLPKCQNAACWHLAFGITLNTQHTNCNALCRHHIAQCYPLGGRWRCLGSCLLLGETRMGPRHRQNGGSGRNGTWDAAGGHFNGTWPPRVARSYPPFVTQRTLLNQATRKSQYMPKRKAYLLLLP
jgi:hypothetical protein